MTLGHPTPLYLLPFDHRGSFPTGMFGWKGALSPEQTAKIAATEQVITDGFQAAVAAAFRRSGELSMPIGMIGLGGMGADMTPCPMRGGPPCVDPHSRGVV